MRRVLRVVSLGLLAALLITSPASAGQPEMERIPIDELFVDDVLSDACGVEVNGHATGHVTLRLFTDAEGNPVSEVNNYALSVRLWSVNGEIFAKDVGADRVTYLEDGGVVVIVIGSVQSFSSPGEGRVYSDVGRSMLVFDSNGDLVSFTPLAGQHDPDQFAAICSVLGG